MRYFLIFLINQNTKETQTDTCIYIENIVDITVIYKFKQSTYSSIIIRGTTNAAELKKSIVI